MKVDVLLGLQWGDEGKGKIVDDQLISNFQNNKIDLEEHFRKLTA